MLVETIHKVDSFRARRNLADNPKISDVVKSILHPQFNDISISFRRQLIESLVTNSMWRRIGAQFSTFGFLNGKTGNFLFAGPVITRRQGTTNREIGGIGGHVDHQIAYHIFHLRRAIRNFSELRGYLYLPVGENISQLLPFHESWSSGPLSGENGEAFITPDAWAFTNKLKGPALLNLTEQRQRFDTKGAECIRKIFEPATAELLISAVNGKDRDMVRALEYSIHSMCHSAGYGYKNKLSLGWFNDDTKEIQDRAFEEYRASSIEYWTITYILMSRGGISSYEIKNKHYRLPFHPGKLLASSCCTMFAMDIHRTGGFSDIDVSSSTLILDNLLNLPNNRPDQGLLVFDKDLRKFRLTVPTYSGLINSFKPIGREGFNLALDESNHSKKIGGLAATRAQYRATVASKETKELINQYMIEPCKGIYQKLR